MDWVDVDQEGDRWRVRVDAVMNLGVSSTRGFFF
jgi:hypothetical protein